MELLRAFSSPFDPQFDLSYTHVLVFFKIKVYKVTFVLGKRTENSP